MQGHPVWVALHIKFNSQSYKSAPKRQGEEMGQRIQRMFQKFQLSIMGRVPQGDVPNAERYSFRDGVLKWMYFKALWVVCSIYNTC